MAQYKGTIVFIEGLHGWTESYYLLASTPSGAAANLTAVAAARLAILESDLILQSASISDVAVRGDSTPVITVPAPGGFESATGYLDLDVSLLMKWQVGVFNRNKTYLRGIPLTMTLDGLYVPTAPYTTALNAYINAVMANCVLPVTSRNPAPPPTYLITSYQPILEGAVNQRLARRKSGRPIGQPRGRRIAP